MNRNTAQQLEPVQLAALRRFAHANGRRWKSTLGTLWETGRDVREQDGSILRRIRNEFGPTYLQRFAFPKRTSIAPALPGFVSHLQDACNALQFGFFFEEGGCWGMALALHQELTTAGHVVDLAIRTDAFTHAFIVCGDEAIDYRGAEPLAKTPAFERHSEKSFRTAVSKYGLSENELEDQVVSATSVINVARTLATGGSTD